MNWAFFTTWLDFALFAAERSRNQLTRPQNATNDNTAPNRSTVLTILKPSEMALKKSKTQKAMYKTATQTSSFLKPLETRVRTPAVKMNETTNRYALDDVPHNAMLRAIAAPNH